MLTAVTVTSQLSDNQPHPNWTQGPLQSSESISGTVNPVKNPRLERQSIRMRKLLLLSCQVDVIHLLNCLLNEGVFAHELVLLSADQRSFSVQRPGYLPRLTSQRDAHTSQVSVQLHSEHLHCPLQSLVDVREGEGRAGGRGRMLYNVFFWKWHGHCTHELTKAVITCTKTQEH